MKPANHIFSVHFCRPSTNIATIWCSTTFFTTCTKSSRRSELLQSSLWFAAAFDCPRLPLSLLAFFSLFFYFNFKQFGWNFLPSWRFVSSDRRMSPPFNLFCNSLSDIIAHWLPFLVAGPLAAHLNFFFV